MSLNKYLYALLASLCSASVYANPFVESFEGPLNVNLNLYAFAADLDGSVRHGSIKYDFKQPFKDTLKHLDSSYMGNLDIRKGAWGIYVDRQIIKLSEDQKVYNVPIAASLKLDQADYGVYYQAYVSEDTTDLGYPKMVVEPTISVRHTEADATVGVLSFREKLKTKDDELFWGSRLKYNFNTPWNLAAELSAGVNGSVLAQGYVGYRIPVMKQHFNVRVGYRYLKQDIQADGLIWNVDQKGPVIGINLPIF